MNNGTADGAPDADGDGDGKPSCGGAPIDPAGPYAGGPWRNYFLILLDRIPTPIAVCQAHGEVLIANPAMAAQWGTVPGQLRGRNLLDLFEPRAKAQLDRLTEALRLGRRSRYPRRGALARRVRRDGTGRGTDHRSGG